MADSYILNVKPVMSASDGRKLENDLNQRFSRVAKKFGGALRTAGSVLKGALAGAFATASIALGGLMTGLVSMMMANPIQKLNQALDESLSKADNIATRAGQIGTTSGKLIQVQAVAESAGVQNFDVIISRFQTELQKSRTGESDLLKEFAGEQDTLEAFIKVIDSIKQLKPAEQNLMISKIFGERANLQLAEFMQADLMQRKRDIFGGRTEEELTQAIDKLATKEDLQAVLRQKTNVEDLIAKSRTITEGTIKLQQQYEKSQKNIENKQMGGYADFAKLASFQQQATEALVDIQLKLTPKVVEGVGYLEEGYNALKHSRVGKWIGKVFE